MKSLNYNIKQPYVATKNIAIKAAIPVWSRPNTNKTDIYKLQSPDAILSQQNGGAAHYKTPVNSWNRSRPIKHWRKQLTPTGVTGKSNSSVSIQDAPSSNVIIKDKCCSSEPGNLLYCDISKYNFVCRNNTCNIIRPTAGMNTKPINPRQTTSGLVVQSYNFDSNSYLRTRNKSYTTNQNGSLKPNIIYSKQSLNKCCHEPIQNSDDNVSGTQIRSSLVFPTPTGELCSSNPRDIIVKPNNKQFFQQGAVSSSSRIDRLKYNTVTANANGFATAWGASAANAGKYRADGTSQYFIKSKNNVCSNSLYNKNKHTLKC